MIRCGDIVKGTCLLQKGQPFLVVEREFHTPGKGTAIARIGGAKVSDTMIKNVRKDWHPDLTGSESLAAG
jgi:translation elongation factor P/translation initiation factor 5A